MCEECTRLSCAACPYAVGGEKESATCAVCDEPIFADTESFCDGTRFICADCADCLTLDEMLLLFELRDASDLLACFGYLRVM